MLDVAVVVQAVSAQTILALIKQVALVAQVFHQTLLVHL
jgi:hypothetical protein